MNFHKANKRNSSERDNEHELYWLPSLSKEKKTTEEIIPLIISEIEAQPIYYRHVNDMIQNLGRIMRFFYADLYVRIKLFGSADTKLALKNSDVDIFLDFQGNFPEPMETLLISLKNKVRKFGYFTRTVPIFARTPIIQCNHYTGLSCDISFDNCSAVLNSQLIKFFLTLDKRIKPLILIIKYLLKAQGLIAPHAITSYSVGLLVLFFLQTLKEPIVPSVCYLQSLVKEPQFITEWDTSFSTETQHFPQIKNKMSVTELLWKFFQFYATFEFGFYVISVFSGKPYLKTFVSDPNLLPVEFFVYKKNLFEHLCEEFEYKKCMCVQDPFKHSINTTRNTTLKSLIQFQQFCSSCAAKGDELWGDDEESEGRKKQFLVSLFDQQADEPKRKKTKVIEPIVIYVEEMSFINPKLHENDLRKKWARQVFNSVTDILTKIMKCEIEIQAKDGDSVPTAFEEQEKTIICEFQYLELINRKRSEAKTEFKFPKEIPVIRQEEMISNYISDTILKNGTKISLKFDIMCTLQKGPTCFCMKLDFKPPNARNPVVEQVFKFIQTSTKWIKMDGNI